MTKFDGNAVSARGRTTGAVTAADRRRELEEWRKTGRHPELVAAAAAAAAADRPLPPPDPDRPHVYLQFGDGARLVFEVYDDVAPGAARVVLAAVDGGSAAAAAIKNVDAGVALHLAIPPPPDGVARPPPPPGATGSTLQHMDRVLSVDRGDARAWLVTLAPRARAYDASHAPAARLVHGDVDTVVNAGVRATAAGRTVARGADGWDAEAAAAATAAAEAADPAAASEAARAQVEDAVQASLKRGREEEEKVGDGGAAKKKTMLDAVLGGGGSDSDGSDGSESE